MLYECLCFNLFVVCQNEDLKHVAGIVTRKWEDKKKNTMNFSLCIVRRGNVCLLFGGISGSINGKSLKITKGVFLSSKWIQILVLHRILPSPLNDVTAVPAPHWSCSRKWIGWWEALSTQRSGLKVPPVTDLGSVWPPCASNLTRKGNVHIWPVISYSGQLHPTPDLSVWSRPRS